MSDVVEPRGKFWLENPSEIFSSLHFLPREHDSYDEKLNALTRLALLISLMLYFFLSDCKWSAYFLIGSLLSIIALKYAVPTHHFSVSGGCTHSGTSRSENTSNSKPSTSRECTKKGCQEEISGTIAKYRETFERDRLRYIVPRSKSTPIAFTSDEMEMTPIEFPEEEIGEIEFVPSFHSVDPVPTDAFEDTFEDHYPSSYPLHTPSRMEGASSVAMGYPSHGWKGKVQGSLSPTRRGTSRGHTSSAYGMSHTTPHLPNNLSPAEQTQVISSPKGYRTRTMSSRLQKERQYQSDLTSRYSQTLNDRFTLSKR